MEKKTYHGRLQLKAEGDGPPGSFRCEFATLNVIDHDGDVTRPGAFREGQEVWIEPWNHNLGGLPVGKGTIHEVDDKAVCDGGFFLDTQNGAEHHTVVKQAGGLQEWSYTFMIEASSEGDFEDQKVRFLDGLDVWGVAPVTRGAGIDTRTTDIKGREREEAVGAKPYPNEHSCRMADPDKFVRCIRKEVEDSNAVDGYEPTGLPYSLIICYTEDEKSEVQAFRYDKDKWTEEQARKHCRAHGGSFEAASGEESACAACTQGKVGARHTAKEVEQIQAIHDHAVALGAKCAEETADTDADQDEDPAKGKSRDPRLVRMQIAVAELLD